MFMYTWTKSHFSFNWNLYVERKWWWQKSANISLLVFTNSQLRWEYATDQQLEKCSGDLVVMAQVMPNAKLKIEWKWKRKTDAIHKIQLLESYVAKYIEWKMLHEI